MRRPPRSTRTATLVPSTTLFRSVVQLRDVDRVGGGGAGGHVDQAALVIGVAEGHRVGFAGHRLGADRHRIGSVDLHQCLRSEEHTSELQSLMRISYAVFCLKNNT